MDTMYTRVTPPPTPVRASSRVVLRRGPVRCSFEVGRVYQIAGDAQVHVLSKDVSKMCVELLLHTRSPSERTASISNETLVVSVFADRDGFEYAYVDMRRLSVMGRCD